MVLLRRDRYCWSRLNRCCILWRWVYRCREVASLHHDTGLVDDWLWGVYLSWRRQGYALVIFARVFTEIGDFNASLVVRRDRWTHISWSCCLEMLCCHKVFTVLSHWVEHVPAESMSLTKALLKAVLSLLIVTAPIWERLLEPVV